MPVQAIADDPKLAYDYTNKGNLVAVISNGTAVLGLGDLGAIAAKPVMEGKSVLFKRFADVERLRHSRSTPRTSTSLHQLRALSSGRPSAASTWRTFARLTAF